MTAHSQLPRSYTETPLAQENTPQTTVIEAPFSNSEAQANIDRNEAPVLSSVDSVFWPGFEEEVSYWTSEADGVRKKLALAAEAIPSHAGVFSAKDVLLVKRQWALKSAVDLAMAAEASGTSTAEHMGTAVGALAALEIDQAYALALVEQADQVSSSGLLAVVALLGHLQMERAAGLQHILDDLSLRASAVSARIAELPGAMREVLIQMGANVTINLATFAIGKVFGQKAGAVAGLVGAGVSYFIDRALGVNKGKFEPEAGDFVSVGFVIAGFVTAKSDASALGDVVDLAAAVADVYFDVQEIFDGLAELKNLQSELWGLQVAIDDALFACEDVRPLMDNVELAKEMLKALEAGE